MSIKKNICWLYESTLRLNLVCVLVSRTNLTRSICFSSESIDPISLQWSHRPMRSIVNKPKCDLSLSERRVMMRVFLAVLLWLSYWWSLPTGHVHFHISKYRAQIWMRRKWDVWKPLPRYADDLPCASGIALWMENWIEMRFKYQKSHTFTWERHFNKCIDLNTTHSRLDPLSASIWLPFELLFLYIWLYMHINIKSFCLIHKAHAFGYRSSQSQTADRLMHITHENLHFWFSDFMQRLGVGMHQSNWKWSLQGTRLKHFCERTSQWSNIWRVFRV